MKDIGKRIREQRKKKGITQEAMANALGVTSQAVSKWENGQNAPDISMIMPICTFLGIGADVLLGGNRQEALEKKYLEYLGIDKMSALLVIEEALKEFPEDKLWLERNLIFNIDLACAKRNRSKDNHKNRAEFTLGKLKHLFPDEDYRVWEAELCLIDEDKESAKKLAYETGGEKAEAILSRCLEGEELIRSKQKKLLLAFSKFHSELLRYNTHESIELADKVMELYFGDEQVLSRWTHDRKRALIYREEGNTEKYIEYMTLAYEKAKACDNGFSESYKSVFADRLTHKRFPATEVNMFITTTDLSDAVLCPLKCRIVEENLKYKPLVGYPWNKYVRFLLHEGNKDPEHWLDFSISFDATTEEWDQAHVKINRRITEGNFYDPEPAMIFAEMARPMLKHRRLTGLIYHLGDDMTAGFCNCGDRDKYRCLGIRRFPRSTDVRDLAYTPEQLGTVPEGAKVFSIVDMAVHRDLRWCGIEKKLIEAACDWAKRCKYEYVEAYLDNDIYLMLKDDEIKSWTEEYEKAGFKIVKDLSEGKYTKLVLQKKI
ncbi:MAG: helix-turn-helix domain-containing protein [Clostridia bacterium]|nr:helix-turn-helix domain-containing protein [Clostridia bacterium]